MTSLAISAVNQHWIYSEWITTDLMMDMKTIPALHIRIRTMRGAEGSFVCLKMSKQIKREKNTADSIFILL